MELKTMTVQKPALPSTGGGEDRGKYHEWLATGKLRGEKTPALPIKKRKNSKIASYQFVGKGTEKLANQKGCSGGHGWGKRG